MAMNFPLIGAMAPTASQLPPAAKRDWRASLFDRLMPDGGLEDDDKEAAMRQGLLGLASGLLGTGGGFGNALSAGIQSGLLATNQSVDNQQDRAYKQQLMKNGMGDTAGVRQFEALATAAGYKPGSEEWKRAAGMQLGMVGKESSAGGQIVKFNDNEGRERVGVFNPRTMQIDLPDGTSYNPQTGTTTPTMQAAPTLGADPLPGMEFDSLRGAVEQVESGGNPNAVSPAGALGRMQTMPDTLRDPGFGVTPAANQSDAERTRVGTDYLAAMLEKYADPRLALAAYNAGPGRVDEAMKRAMGNPEVALRMLPKETQQYVPKVLAKADNPFVGRRPEDEAGAVEGAKIDASLGRGDAVTQMEANRARAIEEAKLSAQREGDKAAAMPKRRLALQQATNKMQNLNRALESAIPNVSVWTAGAVGTPLSKLGGSAAADLRANLDTIEAIVAFDELQQMRASSPTGGALGSVTERELSLLASTIANVRQSQSPEQLRENLTFLGQQYNKVVQQMQADFEADSQMGGTQPSAPQPDQFQGFRVLD